LLNKYYPVRQRNSATWAWWNIADPLDVVAIDKTLSDEGYSDGYIMDVLIDNEAVTADGKRYPHALLGYLQSQPVHDLVKGLLRGESDA